MYALLRMLGPVYRYMDRFLSRALQEYKFEMAPRKIEDFRALLIREGKEKRTKTLQKFFHRLNKLKVEKKQTPKR